MADPLATLGIELAGPDALREVREDSLRAALQLRALGRSVLGLKAVAPRVGVAGTALQLGAALVELGAQPVTVVCPRLRLPPLPGERDPVFAQHPLRPGLTLAVERDDVGASGAQRYAPEVERLVREARARGGMTLVDLTMLRELAASVDAVVVLADVGRASEREIVHARRDLGEGRLAGVLLVGGSAS
jgi:hypothetical protein